jgi:hypothetical protein
MSVQDVNSYWNLILFVRFDGNYSVHNMQLVQWNGLHFLKGVCGDGPHIYDLDLENLLKQITI